jgi:tetratricopeptide (TPR) repeat protein
MTRPACALVLLVLCASTSGVAQKPRAPIPLRPIAPLDLAHLLDLYADGRFDEAVQRVAQAGDEVGRNLRRHWAVTGRAWIDADPARRSPRILAAAALALETEHLRAERGDWRVSERGAPCPASCVLDWAQLQLAEREAPDQGERTWYLAAAALAGGVRDWRYLQRPVDPRRPRVLPGLIDRALVRFPDDSSLRLEQALAAAGRFNVTIDGERSAAIGIPFLPVPGGRNVVSVTTALQTGRDVAAGMLAALVDDPVVGAEARLRLGYLNWTAGRDDDARDHLAKAAHQTGDKDLRYLSKFLLGWIAVAAGNSAGAIPWLEAALADRPASQSASVALAALELQRGNAGRAHEIAQASLDERRADADPWRLFLYGHHPRWPALLAELRREVKP